MWSSLRSHACVAVLSLSLSCRGRSGVVDLEGRSVDPVGGDGPAMLVFVAPTCPISNRYAPELRRLHDRFAPRGVRVFLVYPTADPPDAVREHARAFSLPGTPLRDPRRSLAARAGVRVTPEIALYLSDGTLAYRGRIDDRVEALGAVRQAATTHELEDALAAVVEGRSVGVSRTVAVGCAIPTAE